MLGTLKFKKKIMSYIFTIIKNNKSNFRYWNLKLIFKNNYKFVFKVYEFNLISSIKIYYIKIIS